jgi:hypothetical protein
MRSLAGLYDNPITYYSVPSPQGLFKNSITDDRISHLLLAPTYSLIIKKKYSAFVSFSAIVVLMSHTYQYQTLPVTCGWHVFSVSFK